MSNSLVVAMEETLHKLCEEVSSLFFRESSRDCNEIEDLTTCSELKNNVIDGLLFWWLSVFGIFDILALIDLDLFDDMFVMTDLLHSFTFSLNKLHELGISAIFDDLDGNLSSLWVDSKLNFAAEACSESLSNLVLSNFSWHFYRIYWVKKIFKLY